MRFGLVHRVMTDALAVLGILAIVSTASLSLATNLVLLLALLPACASWPAAQANTCLDVVTRPGRRGA